MECTSHPQRRRRWNSSIAATAAAAIVGCSSVLAPPHALAQSEDNPVYVDDSPRAWELFQQAVDQSEENPGEAARLFQELLDQYAMKLIPRSRVDPDHFVATRRRVNQMLLSQPNVLERYRTIETPRAQRMLERGELEMLRRARFLTAPALEATLRLAQQRIEAAAFQTALRILDEAEGHPDLRGRAAAYRLLMIALAAHYLDDPELRDETAAALAALETADARAAGEELLRITEGGGGPEIERGVSIFDTDVPAALDSIVDNPIWREPLDDTLLRRRTDPGDDPRAMTPGARGAEVSGEFLTVAPAIAGRAIYVNEGQVIRAIDRFSKREFWRRQVGDAAMVNVRGGNSVADLNGIVITGDRLVTVTGHGSSQSRIGTARVACLNRITGEVLWDIGFSRLLDSEELVGLFPLGVPAVADGMVYVLARKITKQVLTSTYLVALDLNAPDNATRIRWVQFIASSANMQGAEVRPFSYPVAHDGMVYAATPMGAAACLDGFSGEVRWLRRIEVPFQMMTSLEPWQMSAPVITEPGVFALSPGQQTIHLLDASTGNQLLQIDAKEWGYPHYLLADDETIYAIGPRDIVAAPLYAPELPLWRLSAQAPPDAYFEMRGRVQLAGDMLIAPTRGDIALIDAVRGEVIRLIDVGAAGNPLAWGPELFFATSSELIAYMPISIAEAMLREQIASSPHNPLPALSLLRLATRAESAEHSFDLALEASEQAMAVLDRIQRAPEYHAAQSELFETLVEISQRSHEVDFERAAALHARMGGVASRSEQRVEHLLAQGDWLRAAAESDPAHVVAALEAYQSIISSPDLAPSARRSREVQRTARGVAIERIAALLERFGEDAYRPFAEEAASRFAALEGAADAAALIELARRYPFADASRQALHRAQGMLAQSNPHEALAAMHLGWRIARDDAQRSAVASDIVRLAVEQGWRDVAMHWLGRARREFAVESIDIGEGPVAAAELMDLLAAREEPRRPDLGLLSVSDEEVLRTLDGRIIQLNPRCKQHPTQYALLVVRDLLTRYNTPDLSVAWQMPLLDGSVELLAHDSGRILIRYPDRDDMVIALDAATGDQVWGSGNLRERFAAAREAPGSRRRNINLEGLRRIVHREEVIHIVADNALIAIGRSGGIARFAFDQPAQEPVWMADHPLFEVHYAAVHDLGIVLVGMSDDETQHELVVIDPATGEVRLRRSTADGQPARWLLVSDAGLAITGTDAAIEAIDLASGDFAWAHLGDAADLAERAVIFGEWIVLADRGHETGCIALRDGVTHSELFQPPSEVTWTPRILHELRPIEGRLLAHYEQRIVWFDQDGRVDGADAVAGDRRFTHVVAGDDLIFAVNHQNRRRGGGRSNRQSSNDVYAMSFNSQLLTDQYSIEAENDTLFGACGVDGWLLLSESGQTLVIPTSAGVE